MNKNGHNTARTPKAVVHQKHQVLRRNGVGTENPVKCIWNSPLQSWIFPELKWILLVDSMRLQRRMLPISWPEERLASAHSRSARASLCFAAWSCVGIRNVISFVGSTNAVTSHWWGNPEPQPGSPDVIRKSSLQEVASNSTESDKWKMAIEMYVLRTPISQFGCRKQSWQPTLPWKNGRFGTCF